ncbi:unnamed protein product [Pleuronectes platessa]|uniref:Uncharacterized protein n=1 Tax=Pleuronectes platessa TaxID=8262 RepID=A0A9N7YRF5_PLEPL|nr:unnamed protein product [Pleuronectes platessa]
MRFSIWVLHSSRPYAYTSQRSRDADGQRRFLSPLARVRGVRNMVTELRVMSREASGGKEYQITSIPQVLELEEGQSGAGVPSKRGHALGEATDIVLEGV